MAKPPRITTEQVLAHLERVPQGKFSFKQLVREMGLKGGLRQELEDTLAHLSNRGSVIALRSGQYVLASKSREFAAGRLRMHRDGYGFCLLDHPREEIRGDVFIPKNAIGSAMHGDRIVVQIVRVDHDGRAEGELYEVLRRGNPTVVGEFRLLARANVVVPHDERLQQWIEIPDGLEKPPVLANRDRIGVAERVINGPEDLDGLIVNVELLEYPEGDSHAVGRVVEVLGHPDDFGVDVEVTIRKHHLPHHFSEAVLAQARSIDTTLTPELLANRTDFRGMDIVTIDGETARDFDDAVWVDRLPNGNFALQVHIADVSHYVQPGSPIDQEAVMRGTSVYFPDRAVPMLPLELSTDVCSLRPNEDRLVLSALLEMDNQGDIVGQEFTRGVIRSVERMTYTHVHQLLEGDAEQRERYARLVPRFELMQEMALILSRKRVKRGSIDFDLPEPVVQFGETGEMTGVLRAPRNIAHRIIEEFMLAANEAVAGYLESLEKPSIYRIHEQPSPRRVMDFQEAASHFGYGLDLTAAPVKRFANIQRTRSGQKIRRDVTVVDSEAPAISSRLYQKLIAKLEGKPEERIVSYLLLRSLKQARYSEKNVGHFALAAPAYTHFTSPIRRYPDLIVHRLLAEVFDKQPPSQSEEELRLLGEDTSFTERRAAEAERELLEWKKAKYMIERVGDEFDAIINSTTRFGFFVELTELFVEGLVPIEFLPGDRFSYVETQRAIIGQRSQRTFRIGDPVRVRLDRVDERERRLTFSLVEAGRVRRKRQ